MNAKSKPRTKNSATGSKGRSAAARKEAYERVGQVAVLGMDEPWQCAMYCPEGIDDFTTPAASVFDLDDGEIALLHVEVVGVPTARYRPFPHVAFQALDPSGASFVGQLNGDTKKWIERIKIGDQFHAEVKVRRTGSGCFVTVRDFVEPAWVGKVRPRYIRPQGCRLDPAAIRGGIWRNLKVGIPAAADRLRTLLAPYGRIETLLGKVASPGWTVEGLLNQVHRPQDADTWHHANETLMDLVALAELMRTSGAGQGGKARPIRLATMRQRIAETGRSLTDDQVRAMREIAGDLIRAVPMRRLLSGDVGTGKSMPAQLIARCVADAGGRVAIMLPNATLATQFHREFVGLFADDPPALVTTDTAELDAAACSILIGTTALLHREVGEMSLVIIDEQHRFSVHQREALAGPNTHLLEMTATCIPRSQALVALGRLDVSHLHTPFRPKTIHTALYESQHDARRFFADIDAFLKANGRILVVYPKRHPDDPELPGEEGAGRKARTEDKHTVTGALPLWTSRYGDDVAAITSDHETAEKEATLARFRAGDLRVMLTTTVVEIGLNLENLYRIVIMDPTRYGLNTLHQLRGRVARHGGVGYCDLYAVNQLKPEQRDRLDYFCATSDGFALAEFDLRRRGAGDLGGESRHQSGADRRTLFGAALTMERYEAVLPIYESWRDAGKRQ